MEHLKKPLYIEGAVSGVAGRFLVGIRALSGGYKFVSSTQYRKDYKRCKKRGWDMELLKEVIDSLCRGDDLKDTHYDHSMTGDYEGCRELHLKDDWILVGEKVDNFGQLIALQTGTHDEVLGKKRRRSRNHRF